MILSDFFTPLVVATHWIPESIISLGAWLNPTAPATRLVAGLLLVSSLFSLLISVFVVALLPGRLHRRPVRNALAIAALGSLLPVLGPLSLLGMGLIFPLLEKNRSRLQPEHLTTPDFASEIRPHSAGFSAGGALARLRGNNGVQGMRALLAIEHRRSAISTRLLSQSLGHPDEIVRLLAYNLLERREQAIVARLSELEPHLDTGSPSDLEERSEAHGKRPRSPIAAADSAQVRQTLDNADTAWLALQAASLHLEFIYLELAQGSLRQTHIQAAARLLADSAEFAPQSPWYPAWLSLQARVLQLQGDKTDDPRIESLLKDALAAGCAPARALPWLLERAWQRRDYATLKHLVEHHHVYSMIPHLGPVVSRWRTRTNP